MVWILVKKIVLTILLEKKKSLRNGKILKAGGIKSSISVSAPEI